MLKNLPNEFCSPEEVVGGEKMLEGRTKNIAVNIYERNARARQQCIAKYGTVCSVCGFDFEKEFGPIGTGFIHVHHLRDLASIGQEYAVDPIADLRPVCPNCHAMLHKKPPNPYTTFRIDELRT